MAGSKLSPSQAEQAMRVQRNREAIRAANRKNAAATRRAPEPVKNSADISSPVLKILIWAVVFLIIWSILR